MAASPTEPSGAEPRRGGFEPTRADEAAPAKRAAFEPTPELIRPVPGPGPSRRPLTTSLGAMLVVLRVVAGFAWLGGIALIWNELTADIELDLTVDDPAAFTVALVMILVVGAAVLVFELGVAWFVYRGANWARIVVMVVATLSVLGSAIEFFTGEQDIALDTTLVTLALDILILLALSSRSARDYARRDRSRDARVPPERATS
ncbi:hypothetical protein ARHIZOSPH14_13150 [Agromyces rhizosphaerae]|uniref:Uncharacterized protein n=1 Tax=Agromyces rhizosphaerae TaxID=88374 RepID=A0A9W6CRA5_9MICO|nr:hypothetical protein [Agromyces rhizosphaerae]GLI27073.1 hypothetical protein ARHIZOSPH14_13150 [Agromyces rhizosphaerae]